MSDEKNIEGLPDIARTEKNKLRVWIIFGIIVILFLFIYMAHRSENKTSNQIEETYSMKKYPLWAQEDKNNNQPKHNLKKEPSADEKNKQLLEQRKIFEERVSAPMMVIHNAAESTPTTQTKSLKSSDPNTQFMNQVSARESDTIYATKINDLSYLVGEGHLIHAILETAINSDLPGYLRAVINLPVYSEDGSRILIPVGSRLIGQYKNGLLLGQTRIFVVWTRLITPDGVSINIASSGVDQRGMTGLNADQINRHFWENLGTSILLSIISAGVDNINVAGESDYNASQAYRIAMANSFAETAHQSLGQAGMTAPTLSVNQGKSIMVFVAHDLNFEEAMKHIQKEKTNIF